MQTVNLTSHFLIAMPGMVDPNFSRSLTYICEHNDKGVLGVVGSDDLKGGLARPNERAVSALAAPSIDIISTAPPNSYDFFSGSSLAAAEVTGIVALLLEKNPKLTPAQIRDILSKTSHPLAPPPGLPDPPVAQADACAAVALLAGGEGCS